MARIDSNNQKTVSLV